MAAALPSALVSGAAVPATLRAVFGARGIAVFELCGTAELGIITYETAAHAGLVLNEGLIAEIGAPGPGDTLAQVGWANWSSPPCALITRCFGWLAAI